MGSWAPRVVFARVSRLGLERVDRATGRFVMGANHFMALAVMTALPVPVTLLVIDARELWTAAAVHVALIAAWTCGLWLNHLGHHRVAVVLGLLAPLVAYTVQTLLLSTHTGFMLALFATGALSFVSMPPSMAPWRWALTLASAAAIAWSYLDTSAWTAMLDVPVGVQRFLLIANVGLATFILGTTAWLNDYYFTRERRRAERRVSVAQHEARTDALTRVANRRGMIESLDALGKSNFYAIGVIDLDRFKLVNDRLGHAEGDKVLTQVATLLAQAFPVHATVARWGGEEFVVLMPATKLTYAVSLMERARVSVEGAFASGPAGPVTLSAGLAAASAGLGWEVTMRVADALLYDAKEAGRNRVRYAQVRLENGDWEL